jgi:hypothetical protein
MGHLLEKDKEQPEFKAIMLKFKGPTSSERAKTLLEQFSKQKPA